MVKRNLAVLLTIAMLLPLASCGNNETSDTQDTANTQNNTSADTTTQIETETELKSGLPDKDFAGTDFHFYVMGKERNANNYSVEIYSAEQTGEVINDAVYNRNMTLADKYNFTISETPCGSGEDMDTTIDKLVQSGDDTYQIAMLSLMESAAIIPKNVLYDLNEVENLDLSKDWWDSTIVKDLSIGGKLFNAMGDINIMDNNATWAVFFNKVLMENNGFEMPYDTVRAGKWTYDAYYAMSSAVAQDLDGNGQMDDNDLWGTVGASENTPFLFFSSGEHFIVKDENDMPVIQTPTDRVYSVIENVLKIQQDKNSTLVVERAKSTYTNVWSDLIRGNFRNDLALFYVAGLLTYTLMRDMESEYGLLPLPKLDEAQTNYWTTINHGNCSTVTIPVSNQNVADTGFVLEAMAFESMKTLTPAYYDVALQRKYMSDEESRDMLAIILENRTIDQSVAYNWGGLFGTLSGLTTTQNADFASKFAKMEPTMQTAMDKFIENIEK